MSLAYESDFNLWIEEQTRLLKEHKFDQLDIEHLIEEMENLGCFLKNVIESHLTNIILHMLKNRFQPDLTCNSWNASITGARASIKKIIKKNPSLKNYFSEVLGEAYEDARKGAVEESGIKKETFPVECPWSLEEILG